MLPPPPALEMDPELVFILLSKLRDIGATLFARQVIDSIPPGIHSSKLCQ